MAGPVGGALDGREWSLLGGGAKTSFFPVGRHLVYSRGKSNHNPYSP